ncbi:RHS repeat-associated core domain-containing protein [Pantoea sp.]|uniref:RHS repeat-associated core domain-containing protein n=1 Tax=Pantoea sp. TaxID=69393 RepID=UPI0031CF63EF
MSHVSERSQVKTSAVTETTCITYDPQTGLPVKMVADDGMTTHLCYYPATATQANRSDKVPDLAGLLSGLLLEDNVALWTAAALQCPVVPDASQPPLLAQCQYLAFPDQSTSDHTLTLYGYADASVNAKGMLEPDTVLTVEGITASGFERREPWAAEKRDGREGLTVSLVKNVNNASSEGVARSVTRTATTWYKDNTARRTQILNEVMRTDGQDGTLTSITSSLLSTGERAIVSQQVLSARSGHLLRDTQQDENGIPKTARYHTYDARGRGLTSVTMDYESNTFSVGVSPEAQTKGEDVTWTDVPGSGGTWVGITGRDGRRARTLYDGLQRAVRRELQRIPGDNHAASNYCRIEDITYDNAGAIAQKVSCDYLPGGLCVEDDAVKADPLQSAAWFWQAEKHSTAAESTGEVLKYEQVTGLFASGKVHTQERRQKNLNDGSVVLTQKRWSKNESANSNAEMQTQEIFNVRGQRTSLKQTIPAMPGGTTRIRTWQMAYDDLGRQTSLCSPDGATVFWSYQGLSGTPVSVSLMPKNGTAKILGSQALSSSGNLSNKIIETVRGSDSSGKTLFNQKSVTLPDSSELVRLDSDDGNSVTWMTKKGTVTTPLVSFTYNATTRVLTAERPAQKNLQSRIVSESFTPLLLGQWRLDRIVRTLVQQQRAQLSLRGRAAVGVQYASGVHARTFRQGKNMRSHVRRGALDYHYQYTALGRLAKVAVQELRSGHSMVIAFEHDAFGRETGRTCHLDGALMSRYEQSWSAVGQLLSKALYLKGSTVAARTETFIYFTSINGLRDELQKWTVTSITGSEIKDADGRILKEQTYTYDVLGNLTKCITTFADNSQEIRENRYDDPSQSTKRTSVVVTFISTVGASGNPVTLNLLYDANGNLVLNEQQQTLTYTETGQLQAVTDLGSTSPQSRYEYDESGRMVAQWDDAKKQYRVLAYSGEMLCEETWQDKDGATIRRRLLDEEAGLVVQVVQGSGDEKSENLLFTLADPQGNGGEEFWLKEDGQWGARRLGLTPWGEAPLADINAMQSGLGYNDQRPDPVTGHFHLGNGYRVYDPRHRAFYQPDGLSPFGAGGLNDRAYCAGGDPVNWHDPSGHIMMSRRDEAASLANLDGMIKDTAPPYHEPTPWWQWALLAVSAAAAIALTIATFGAAAPMLAALAVVTIGMGTGLTALGMSMRQSNPALSGTLESAGNITMMIGSLPTAAAGISNTVARVFMYATATAAIALETASVVLHQSNPDLANKLGWGAKLAGAPELINGLVSVGNGVKKGLQELRNLRNNVKFHGVKSLFKPSRSSHYAIEDMLISGAKTSKNESIGLVDDITTIANTIAPIEGDDAIELSKNLQDDMKIVRLYMQRSNEAGPILFSNEFTNTSQLSVKNERNHIGIKNYTGNLFSLMAPNWDGAKHKDLALLC